VATNRVQFGNSVRDSAIDILVAVIYEYFNKSIPKPVIKVAVMAAIAAVGNVDERTIRKILKKLGSPVDTATTIMDIFIARMTTEVECPDSGSTITMDEGDGEYTCPECGRDIVVEDLEATHMDALEVECPETGKTETMTEGDGEYACSYCKGDILVEDGIAAHEYVFTCRYSKKDVRVGPAPGTYDCPRCGDDIEIDEDGELTH